MRLFHNDYNEACHQQVMRYLVEVGTGPAPGYGTDELCAKAAFLIRQRCKNDKVDVHFLVGGTQTNLTLIAAALRPHQGVIAAETGHVSVHETGAIEATGHKVITLPSADGKITARQVAEIVRLHREDGDREHIVQPKLVYISQPTEMGTVYDLNELTELSDLCKENGLYLYVDGARLGYALAAKGNDVQISHLAELCDAFYIGGTKVGAMFGEALVITNTAIGEDFRYIIKQRGGMLAKGWLLGVQFMALFENDLYKSISAHANRLADRIRDTIASLPCDSLAVNTTNQIFPILSDEALDILSKEFTFCEFGRVDKHRRAVRFCTSWATREEDVDALCKALCDAVK